MKEKCTILERLFHKLFLKMLVGIFIYLAPPYYLWGQDNESLLKKAFEMVYLDEFFDSQFGSMQFKKDSIISTYQATELEFHSFHKLILYKFYKITPVCNCDYIIAIKTGQGIADRIYKLKGFRTSEFIYFFNSVLKMQYRKKSNRFLIKNIFIEGLDLREYYGYYIKASNRISKNLR